MSNRLNGGGAAHEHAGRDDHGAFELRAQLQLLLRQRLGFAAASCVLGAAGTASVFAAWVARMRPPRLRFAPTAANLALLRSIPLLHRSYVPHILAWNAHLAGIIGYIKLPVYRYLGRARAEETVLLSDGGCVSLLWATGSAGPREVGAPVLLLLPGINNDACMGYVQHVQAVFADALPHVAVAALNWRGLGGLPLTSPRPYSAACHTDVADVLVHLRARHPTSALYAAGWSQGGNVLINHLASAGDGCLLTAALAVSPAMDPGAVDAHFDATLLGRTYRRILLVPLLRYYLRHRVAMGHGTLAVLRGFAGGHFFESLGLPSYGVSADALRFEATSAARVGAVRRPLLVIASEDDPIVPLASLPLAAMEANEHSDH